MRMIWSIAVAGALVGAMASAQEATDPPLSADWAKWNAPVAPFRIGGPLYYVGAANVASYAVRTREGVIVIDTGFGQTVPLVVDSLRRLGIAPADVKLILTTQAHVDHVGGVAALKALTGARLAASREDAALMARGGRGDFAFGDDLPYRPVRADRIIADGERITLGGVTLTARLTPGHTRGCTSWSMRIDDGGKQRDVLLLCGTSAPGYRLVDNRAWPEIVPAYRASFARMAALPCDILLTTHPQSIDLTARAQRNALVDPARCKSYIEGERVAFERQLARQEAGEAPAGS